MLYPIIEYAKVEYTNKEIMDRKKAKYYPDSLNEIRKMKIKDACTLLKTCFQVLLAGTQPSKAILKEALASIDRILKLLKKL